MVTIIDQPHRRKVWRGKRSEYVDANRIGVRARDSHGNRVEKEFVFDPHVYLNPSRMSRLERKSFQGVPEVVPIDNEMKFMKELREWKREEKRVSGWEYDGTLDEEGKSLLRVDFHNQQARNRFVRNFTPLYNSRIKHDEQFCVRPPIGEEEFDPLFDSQNPTHTLYFDLELLQYRGGADLPKYTNSRHDLHSHTIGLNKAGQQEMSTIAVYADWLDTFVVWVQHPRFPSFGVDELPKEYKGRGEVRIFNDEKDLLADFTEWVKKNDPDILVAWNGDGYDLPMLWYRLEVTGVGAGSMSPYGIYEPPAPWWDEDGNKSIRDSYRPSHQPIRGRASLDLMPAFVQWWRSTKGQDLGKRCSLDRATNELLKEYISVSKAKDFQPNFFDKDYDAFIEDYIYYNIMDVDSMVQIENYGNIIKLHIGMQDFLKVPFGSTFNSTRFCGVMFSKQAGFLPQDPVWDMQKVDRYEGVLKKDLSYEGAEVVDVKKEGNSGVHKNILAYDAAQMYPANIIGKNISWETAYVPQEGDPNAVTYDIHVKGEKNKDGTKNVVGTETVAFSTDYKGALPEIVETVLRERARYKAEMKQCLVKGDELGAKQADNMQKAVKIIANSFYGVLGNGWEWGRDSIKGTPWALAGATTNFGKRQLNVVREYCESLGHSTIFGHTDSVFMKIGDDLTPQECVDKGNSLTEEISSFVQNQLGHRDAEWELEQYMDRFFIAKKNRYAGRVCWADGAWVDNKPLEKRLKVSGFELKRANSSKAIGDAQLECLDMLFSGRTRNDIVDYLKDRFNQIIDKKVPLSDLASRSTIRQHLPCAYKQRGYRNWVKCDCKSCPIMVQPTMTTEEKKGLRERHKDRMCYAISGKKGSHYLRYTHGEALWRLLNEAPAAAAWYNDFIVDDTKTKIGKGESFYVIPVKDGPHPVPYKNHTELQRSYGFVGCTDLEQIKGFTIDYEVYAYDAIVSPLKNVFEGMNWSVDLIRNIPAPLLHSYLY